MSESIQERQHTLTSSVRIRLIKKGFPSFSLTFDDWDAACEWLDENRERFQTDPQAFFDWKDKLYCEMRRHRVQVMDHIIRPKMRNK